MCFTIPIVQDRVCEGEVDSEGVPAVEVFSAVVRSEVGSDVEVIGAGRIASISIEDSAECSTWLDHHSFHNNNIMVLNFGYVYGDL